MARSLREEPGFETFTHVISRYPVLNREQEVELARRFRDEGDRAAADTLVQCHLKSVVKMAQKYRGYNLYLSDLVAEGSIGLLKAVKRFDPDKGVRFLTYARHWVRAYMLAYILKHWSIVDLGTTATQSKLFFKLQAERARLVQELGEDDESITSRLAESFNTSEERVRTSLERLGRRDVSLDVPVLSDSTLKLIDLVREEGASPEARTAAAETVSMVREAVDNLTPSLDCREQLILNKRLLAQEPVTLAALGRRLGVTRERVRQLEVGLKGKLRQSYLRLVSTGPRLGGAAA